MDAVLAIGMVIAFAVSGYCNDVRHTRLVNERNEAQDEARRLKSLLALSNEPDAAMAFAIWLQLGFDEMKRHNIDIESLIAAERCNQPLET